MYFPSLFFFICFLPVICGMVGAFLAGKNVGLKAYKTSDGVWYGYGKGLLTSIYVFIAELVIFTLLPMSRGSDGLVGLIGPCILFLAIFSIFSMLVGLILYTASSFFGFGIGKQFYVAQLIEKEANKTQEQIEREICSRQNTKPHLD